MDSFLAYECVSKSKKPERCALCERRTVLTFHHLIPRKLHRRNAFKKRFERSELQKGVWLCRPCHSGVHKLYDEVTLGREFYTLERLASDPGIAKHAKWVSKQRRAN